MKTRHLTKKTPKVALIYDWVTTPYGGAEKVLLALHQLYPGAPLFTSIYNPDQTNWARVFDIRPSFLQNLPKFLRNHRLLAPLMPLAFEYLDLNDFDLIISVTSASAKGVITTPSQLHISYLLTPPRFVYTHRQQYLNHLPLSPLLSLLSKPVFEYAKRWDLMAAERPNVLIPISNLIKKRISRFYHRTSGPVIYPPVELAHKAKNKTLPPQSLTKPLLVVSRLVRYKRIDVAIQACLITRTPLVIIGEGPEKKSLQYLARHASWITFKGHVSQTKLAIHYHQAAALLMPGQEDFGITALEAFVHHIPVIIHRDSGAAELIEDGKTGIHISNATPQAMIRAIRKLPSFTPKTAIMDRVVRQHSTQHFIAAFDNVVREEWKKHSK